FFMRRYRNEWHLRFTYVMSAAFDSGVAFMGLLSFFIFTMRNAEFPEWWGNPAVSKCPLDGYALMAPKTPVKSPFDPTVNYTFPIPHEPIEIRLP
ncbi:hypothetical protein BGW39_002057, partial [Mortierella sp. 14UC]